MKKTILFLFLLTSIGLHAQLQKTEPPFWWSEMQLPELQIMFYGENIADYEVSVSDEVVINNIRKTENPNYVFVTIASDEIPVGSIQFSFQKEGKTVFTKEYEFKKRQENSRLREGFDASDVIYLLMPDRFANGNPQNDSHPKMTEKANREKRGGRHGGDIQGIIDHLDYLEDLGVTAIWSTPLLEDNDATYSYHTYAQSDVYQIDPRFGTNKDYQRLADELHQRDMKLIMDYVTNHWGSEHWMINDLPTYDWIHQFPGYANSNYRMTTQYDPHGSEIDKKYCVNGWFVSSMPDLNQSNPLVLNYLIQNAIWWIEFADLDGFRVDTYSYNDKQGIAKWTKAVMDEYPNFNIVGEVWMHDQAQIAYWQKDSKVGAIQSYNSHLPSVMDFTLHDALSWVFNVEKADWNRGMIAVYRNFVNDFLYPNPDNLLVFAGNHDTNRINEIYDGNLDKYKLAMTIVLTTRGIPQIYYGDEIGMRGEKSVGDGDIRRDFPGGWEGDSTKAFSESGRTKIQNAYHSFTKKLLNYRKNKEVLHFGKLLQYLPQDNVYVFFRYNEEESVMVIVNNNLETKTFDLDRFSEGIKDFKAGKDILSGKEFSFEENLKIEGKTSMVIELN
ncbi:MAG TPA: glycoside hydrolase family 13 protein [Flavobacteriaceae bacterium]|nr:glycoside hydrolase family 13 protein [Flavobacteriaceae bacterium]